MVCNYEKAWTRGKRRGGTKVRIRSPASSTGKGKDCNEKPWWLVLLGMKN